MKCIMTMKTGVKIMSAKKLPRRVWRVQEITCPFCDGTGQERERYDDVILYSEEPCHVCLGKGYYIAERDEVQGEKMIIFSEER